MRIRTSPQPGQRMIVPIAVAYTTAAPIGPTRSQLAQITSAVVISTAKICPRTPPAALPSSCCSSLVMLSSTWSKPLGLDAQGVVTELHQRRCDRLDQRCRAADERAGLLRRRPGHFLQHRRVDPPAIASPVRWLLARERVCHHQRRVGARQPRKLLAVDDLVEVAR